MAAFWTWLNTPPTYDQILNPFGAIYLLLFAAGFVVSAWLYGPGAAQLGSNNARTAGLRHWSYVGLWIFGPGLFFFGVGALQINPLSFGEPIWLVGSVIALLIAGFRCVHWWRLVYPRQLLPAAPPPPSPNGVESETDDATIAARPTVIDARQRARPADGARGHGESVWRD